MAFIYSVSHILSVDGVTKTSDPQPFTGSAPGGFNELIAVGTDTQVNLAIDVSAVKLFWIKSDRAVQIETNSGSAPTNTLTLVAGQPYFWHTNAYDTFKLTGDVTAFFVTNASGGSATIECYFNYDATP